MFKKLFVALALFAYSMPALGEQIMFYDKQVSANWSVKGAYYSEGEQASACFAFVRWVDGSALEFNRPLDPKLDFIWMSVRNVDWAFTEDAKKQDNLHLRLNVFDKKGKVLGGGMFAYSVMDKSRIIVSFKPPIEEAFNLGGYGFNLIFQNSAANMRVIFEGTWKPMYNALTDCINAAKAKGVYGTPPEKKQQPKGRDV